MRWRYNIMSHSTKSACDASIMPSFFHWYHFDVLFFQSRSSNIWFKTYERYRRIQGQTYNQWNDAKKAVRWKWLFVVTEYFNIVVNDFDAKKSTRNSPVLVVTKLVVNRAQCTLHSRNKIHSHLAHSSFATNINLQRFETNLPFQTYLIAHALGVYYFVEIENSWHNFTNVFAYHKELFTC